MRGDRECTLGQHQNEEKINPVFVQVGSWVFNLGRDPRSPKTIRTQHENWRPVPSKEGA